MMAHEQVSRGFLTASEAVAVFSGALNEELGLATAGLFDGEAFDDRTPRVLEAVYRIAARLDPEAKTVAADLLEAHSHNFSDADRRAVVLSFDRRFLESQQRPYVDAHGEQAFRGAARASEKMFACPSEPREPDLDERFFSAVEAEYGIGLRALARFTIDCSNEAASKGTNILRLARSEVVARLAGDPDDFPAADPERAFETLTLRPRPKWDEPKPEGAKARDWYPWRFSRRLSLLQRPMIRIGTGADPTVLVLPTLLDSFVQRLFAAEAGSLPMDLYSSPAMRSWIGTAVDREGHDFNERVEARLAELGWITRADVKLTELGGTKGLGDVDVVAWHAASERSSRSSASGSKSPAP